MFEIVVSPRGNRPDSFPPGFWKRTLAAIGIAIALWLSIAVPVGAAELPQADETGNYSGRSCHQHWEVVDPDPNGLNCRRAEIGLKELYGLGLQDLPEIGNWEVIGTLSEGETFTAALFPSGFNGVYDKNSNPWLFVDRVDRADSPSQCLVRANANFVKPIEPAQNCS
ncbi:hypothetical protein [Baaleninema simplex]|uniref:hypothetical protein n=1 Tax=Baaleninema simplex TaxID=2862350 RepID=UPI00034CEB0F|nr:hypothetical protein [Baaleninema simplex]